MKEITSFFLLSWTAVFRAQVETSWKIGETDEIFFVVRKCCAGCFVVLESRRLILSECP